MALLNLLDELNVHLKETGLRVDLYNSIYRLYDTLAKPEFQTIDYYMDIDSILCDIIQDHICQLVRNPYYMTYRMSRLANK